MSTHSVSAPAPLEEPPAARPVADASRIEAIDVARGVALLGIVIVNMAYFATAFGATTSYAPAPTLAWYDVVGWWIGKGLTEGNFYSMFATLFGAGLAIQFASAPRGKVAGRAARRLGFLALMGVLHALLLWYGDILFMYAIFGSVAVCCVRMHPRTLLVIAASIFGVSVLLMAGVMGLEAAFGTPSDANAPPPALDASLSPFFRLMEARETYSQAFDPSNPIAVAMETEAYAKGPYLDLFLFRFWTWAMFLIFVVLGMGWMILALMLLGMALVKSGFFSPQRVAWQRAAARFALLPGLGVVVLGVVLMGRDDQVLFKMLGMVLRAVGNTACALGMLGFIALACRSHAAGWLRRGVARMGRMALTNYLLQTIVCTTIFYFYGLGLFGQVGELARVGIALGVWVLGFGVSAVLAPRLQFGPFEWAWRCVTYWKLQPITRGPGSSNGHLA